MSKLKHILSGQFLANKKILDNWKLILYICFLIVLYISVHFGVKDALATQVKNEESIKNLKSEYTSKSTRLLYLSKKGEIKKRLVESNSSLESPKNPPTIVKRAE